MSGSLGERGVREVEKGDRLMLSNLGVLFFSTPQECKEAVWGYIGAAWGRGVAPGKAVGNESQGDSGRARETQGEPERPSESQRKGCRRTPVLPKCHVAQWFRVMDLPPGGRGFESHSTC
jgi:hypothetical protein